MQLLEEKGIISTSDSANRNSLNAPKDTRDKVVHELLETERKYVQDLEILQVVSLKLTEENKKVI